MNGRDPKYVKNDPYTKHPDVTYQKPFQLTQERKEQWQRQCP